MRTWCKFLPFAFVCWYARKNGERYSISGRIYVSPFNGVLIEVAAHRAQGVV